MCLYRSMTSAIFFVIFLLFISVSAVSAEQYSCDPTLSCGCSKASTNVTARIVGGEIAANQTWGWMASLRESGDHICGASLLSSEYAITAAHCVNGHINTPSYLSIRVGTNYLGNVLGGTAQQRTVKKVIVHPDYDPDNLLNDIAIIKFSPLTMSANSTLGFICIPVMNEDPFEINSNLVAIGWGYTIEVVHEVSNVLRQVTLQVYSTTSQACSNSLLLDPPTQFCAGDSTGVKGSTISYFFCFSVFLLFLSYL